MKRFIYFALSLMFMACNNDEVFYSCNESEDLWVKQNFLDIQALTRTEWNTLDENLKVPAYRSFSLEKKQHFWIDKLEYVLTSFQWNNKEYEHLLLIKDSIAKNLNWFVPNKNKSDKELNEYQLFAYNWMEYSKEELNWSDELIAAICGTMNEFEYINGKVSVKRIENRNISTAKTRSEVYTAPCNCKYENVILTTCLFTGCVEGYCTKTEDGCGWLLGEDCNGLCMPHAV